MANTSVRISGKRNKVASHLKIVQTLGEQSFYTNEKVPNAQNSNKSNKIYCKTSRQPKLESNGHMQGQIPFPNQSKQNKDIFRSSYKIKAVTPTANVFQTNKSKHLHGSKTEPQSSRFRKTHFQNSNISNFTHGNTQDINTDIFVPTRNEIVYNMTNPQITPLMSDGLTHRNKRNSFTAEIHQQTGDNVPERNDISYRESEMASRDRQHLFYCNSHDRSTHPNNTQQVNANIFVPTREEILYLNNVNPTVHASSIDNGLIEYRRNSAAAYAQYLENQGRNNTTLNAYRPSTRSPAIMGNNIGQHSPYREARNTLHQTPPLRNEEHQINHNSPRNNTNMFVYDSKACNTSIDYVYSNKGESEVFASAASPRIIHPTLVKYFPPFNVPQTDVFYSESETKCTHGSRGFETEKKDAISVESLHKLYVLNAEVAPPVCEESTETVGELQYKIKNARVKCSCGKKMRFQVSVLDNDQRNCATCYSRVKGEFKDMFESYKKQGFNQCSCKGDLSITDVTNNYLKDKKLQCTCDDGFKAVHTCRNKPSPLSNNKPSPLSNNKPSPLRNNKPSPLCNKSQSSKKSRTHHRGKASCKEISSDAMIKVYPVTQTGGSKLPDHLHKSSLGSSAKEKDSSLAVQKSSAKEKKSGLALRKTEVYSFTKTSSSNLLSSLQKTISDNSKNILSSLEKVEIYLATATGISNKTDVVPKSYPVLLAKESASQLQKCGTSKVDVVVQDTSSNQSHDYPKLSSVSSATKSPQLANDNPVEEQTTVRTKDSSSNNGDCLPKSTPVDEPTVTTDTSSNKPNDYPKSSSVSSAKETPQLAKDKPVEEQTTVRSKDRISNKLNWRKLRSPGKEKTSQLEKYKSVDEQTVSKVSTGSSNKPHDYPKLPPASSVKGKTPLAKYETVEKKSVRKESSSNKLNWLHKISAGSCAGEKTSSSNKPHDYPKSSSAKKNSKQEGSYQKVETLTDTETDRSDRHHSRHKRSSHSSGKRHSRHEGSHHSGDTSTDAETTRSDRHHSRHGRSSHSSAKKKKRPEESHRTDETSTDRESASSDRHHSRHERSSHSSAKKKKKFLADIDKSHRNAVEPSSSGASRIIRVKERKPQKQNKSRHSLPHSSTSHNKLEVPGKERVVNSNESNRTRRSVTILPNILHNPSSGSADTGIKLKGILLNRSQSQSSGDNSTSAIIQRKRSSYYSRTRFV